MDSFEFEDLPKINGIMPVDPCFNFGLFSSSNSGKTQQALAFINNFKLFYPLHDVKSVIIISPSWQKSYDSIVKKYGKSQTHFFTSFDLRLFDHISTNEEMTRKLHCCY